MMIIFLNFLEGTKTVEGPGGSSEHLSPSEACDLQAAVCPLRSSHLNDSILLNACQRNIHNDFLKNKTKQKKDVSSKKNEFTKK